jgi:hypothetical protein
LPQCIANPEVLVKVYQRGALLGWIYMDKSAVERLHKPKAQTAP